MALKIERARLAAGCFLLGLIALLGSGVKYQFDPVID